MPRPVASLARRVTGMASSVAWTRGAEFSAPRYSTPRCSRHCLISVDRRCHQRCVGIRHLRFPPVGPASRLDHFTGVVEVDQHHIPLSAATPASAMKPTMTDRL